MSASSGFGPLSAVTMTGSKAIPQIKHDPGPERRISGMHRAGVLHALVGRGHPPAVVIASCTSRVRLERSPAVPGAEVVRLPRELDGLGAWPAGLTFIPHTGSMTVRDVAVGA